MPRFEFDGSTGKSYWTVPEVFEDYRLTLEQGDLRAKVPGNRARFETEKIENAQSGRTAFAGGTQQEILDAERGIFNLDKFIKTYKELSGSMEKIDAILEPLGTRRKRFLSEHDGDMDLDRIYERTPFYASHRDNHGLVKMITINVDFSFNAGIEAKEITEFGYFAWAVAHKLESIGIQTNVNIMDKGNTDSMMGDGRGPMNAFELYISLKKAGDYTSMFDIARCFTSNFFRRCIFNMIVKNADECETVISSSLGQSVHTPASSSPGIINLSIEKSKEFKCDFKGLEKFLQEALGIETKIKAPTTSSQAQITFSSADFGGGGGGAGSMVPWMPPSAFGGQIPQSLSGLILKDLYGDQR